MLRENPPCYLPRTRTPANSSTANCEFAQGVILMRLAGLSADLKAAIVAFALQEHAVELPSCFAVITPSGVRLRKSTAR